jgi:hypothetical protein
MVIMLSFGGRIEPCKNRQLSPVGEHPKRGVGTAHHRVKTEDVEGLLSGEPEVLD